MRLVEITNIQFESVNQRPAGYDCLECAPGYIELD